MRTRWTALAGMVAMLGMLACDDGGGPDGNPDAAALFDGVADSLYDEGDLWRAEALRHAARIVRLVGEPTEVALTVDGEPRRFLAVAEELDVPHFVCRQPADTGVMPPPPDGGLTPPDSIPGHGGGSDPGAGTCAPEGSYRMRTLIAWEPERLAEVVRLVADEGRATVEPTVPDPMVDPASGSTPTWDDPAAPSDSVVASPPRSTPGFMGEWLVRDEGIWWSVDGTQENALVAEGGACREANPEFDWARFRCEAIRLRFGFRMTVQRFVMVPLDGWHPIDSVPPMPDPESRLIEMATATVNGARLAVEEWTMPPVPVDSMPEPMPMPLPPGGPGRIVRP